MDKIRLGKISHSKSILSSDSHAGDLWPAGNRSSRFVPLLQDQAEIISSIDTQKVADSLERAFAENGRFHLYSCRGDEALLWKD